MRRKKSKWWLVLFPILIVVVFLVFLQNKPKQKSIKISPREAIILEVVEFVKTLQTNEVSTKLDKISIDHCNFFWSSDIIGYRSYAEGLAECFTGNF